MELLHTGVFNSWTEKSLSRLTELMPGRYAKHETSSGFLDAIDNQAQVLSASQVLQPTEVGRAITQGAGFTDQMRADYQSAVAMLKQERYEPGIALLLKMTEKIPRLTAVHIDLGIAYARTGDLDRAEASLNKALESDPNSLLPITNSVCWSGAKHSLRRRARATRRPWHSPAISNMRTGTLRFCATCISGITPARWSITSIQSNRSGRYRRRQVDCRHSQPRKKQENHEEHYRSLDLAWAPCVDARGCNGAASSAAKDGSSTGTHGKAAGKDRRAKKEDAKKEDAKKQTEETAAKKEEDGKLTSVPGGKALGMSILGNQEAPKHWSSFLEEFGTRQWPQRLDLAR